MYKINYHRLVEHLLPVVLRLPRITALAKVLTSPIKELHAEFLQYREYALNELNHNGQIIYLEKYLNDKFDSDLRRISIAETPDDDNVYFYTYSENKGPIMRTYAEGSGPVMRTYAEEYTLAEFIININNRDGDLNPDLDAMRSVIDLRKAPSSIYEFNVIT